MSLYIGNLSTRFRRGELERVFGRFGRCNVQLKDGYGFVVYNNPPNAEKALRALQGRNICGEPLTLTWSNKQPKSFKKFARVDRSYDHEPLRMRSSGRGGDYGISKSYCGARISSAELLNAERDYHQDHVKEYTREDIHQYREDLLNEGGHVESNLMDCDRWDGKRRELSDGSDEHVVTLDRYVGYDSKDDDEDHRIVYPSGSLTAHSSQEKIARELIGEVTLNHPNDLKMQQACYNCGALGHKKRNCPLKDTSRRYFSRFDHRHDNGIDRGGRGQGGQASFGSNARANLQPDKDFIRTKSFKDARKASGLEKHRQLVDNGSSPISNEICRAWEKDHGGNKHKRRGGGSPKRHSAKKIRPISSPHHHDYNVSRSHSKSKSLRHLRGSIPHSRSRSVSSQPNSLSSNLRSRSVSHNSGSRSSKSSSRSSSPTSLSLSVSLSRPLPSSPNKGQLILKGLESSTTPETTEIINVEPPTGDVLLENANVDNGIGMVNIESTWSSAKEEEDQAVQRCNGDNHMTLSTMAEVKNPSISLSEKGAVAVGSVSPESLRKIKGSPDFDVPTVEDAVVPPTNSDSEINSSNLMSILPNELCMAMKHYGLKPPDENERHLSAEAYFGSARLWPWEIVYYRRLKKGPFSTENYARRVAQNEEFGIVDKYIRSSSGWGELNHPWNAL